MLVKLNGDYFKDLHVNFDLVTHFYLHRHNQYNTKIVFSNQKDILVVETPEEILAKLGG